MDANLIPMSATTLEELADRIGVAKKRAASNRDEWIEITLELAAALGAARQKSTSDIAFGHWIVDAGHNDINKDDQAALINMADDLPLARIMLQESKRNSWQHIWRHEMQERFRHVTRPAPESRPEPESAPAAPTSPVSSPCDPTNATETPEPAATADAPTKPSSRGRSESSPKSEFIKNLGVAKEEAAELMGAYPYNRQHCIRAAFNKYSDGKLKTSNADGAKPINKKMVRDLFYHALAVVRSGKAIELTNSQKFDARIFLPNVPLGICQYWEFSDLLARLDRLATIDARAAEMIAANAPLHEIHIELKHLWETGSPAPPKEAPVIKIDETDSKNRIKHEVTYCGEVIWPNPYLTHVSFEDMWMGWHIADYWLKHLEVATPKKPNEILVEIMHLVQDLRAASSIMGVTDVITTCASAYAKRNQRKDKADFSGGMPPAPPR